MRQQHREVCKRTALPFLAIVTRVNDALLTMWALLPLRLCCVENAAMRAHVCVCALHRPFDARELNNSASALSSDASRSS